MYTVIYMHLLMKLISGTSQERWKWCKLHGATTLASLWSRLLRSALGSRLLGQRTWAAHLGGGVDYLGSALRRRSRLLGRRTWAAESTPPASPRLETPQQMKIELNANAIMSLPPHFLLLWRVPAITSGILIESLQVVRWKPSLILIPITSPDLSANISNGPEQRCWAQWRRLQRQTFTWGKANICFLPSLKNVNKHAKYCLNIDATCWFRVLDCTLPWLSQRIHR